MRWPLCSTGVTAADVAAAAVAVTAAAVVAVGASAVLTCKGDCSSTVGSVVTGALSFNKQLAESACVRIAYKRLNE
jgi:hypothetical protein